jgi:peptidoglycan LD-endopeptidase CwlK
VKERPWPSLSKLSRDRLQGVHPDLVRVVERAIQITTQDFREGLRTRERQAELVARGGVGEADG